MSELLPSLLIEMVTETGRGCKGGTPNGPVQARAARVVAALVELVPEKSSFFVRRHMPPLWRQQFLKAATGTARTGVVSAKFFEELLLAVDGSIAALHIRFRRESFATLATALERRIGWY